MTGAPHQGKFLGSGSPDSEQHDWERSPTVVAQDASEKAHPLFMDQLPGLVWVTNLEQRVTRALGNCLDSFTHGESFVPGLTLQELFGTQDPDFPPIRAHRLAKGGYAAPFEFTLDRHYIGVTEPIYDAAGNAIGTISLAQDQTDCKITQQNQRVQFLRNLTAGLMRHLNSWLTNVVGRTELALAKLPAQSEARKILEQIQGASQSMTQLVEEMMCYTQSKKIHSQPLHLSRLIEDAKPHLDVLISKSTQVSMDLAKELPLVAGDIAMLTRMVLTLICAAAEMNRGETGRISVRTHRARVNNALIPAPFRKGDVPDGEYVQLQVTCHNCPVDEATRRKMFEPFSSPDFSGCGLGLAAVKGTVTLHRGYIATAVTGDAELAIHVLLPGLPSSGDIDIKALERTVEIDITSTNTQERKKTGRVSG